VDDPVQAAEPSPVAQEPPRGSETLLLVEDEEAVRALAARVLKANGYTVLTAADADEAEHISANYASAIDLLITDVIMPRTSGPQLARRLLIVRPQMRVLYISGYTDAAVAEHGGLDAEAALFQKPFTPSSLAKKVREILDERRSASGG
jgi:DNA-binding response OmpR family regulator